MSTMRENDLQIKTFSILVLLIVGSIIAVRNNASPEGPIIEDAAARAVYSKMIETIKEAKSLFIESKYRTVFDGQELPASTYRLWLKKPYFARMEGMLEEDVVRGVLIGDGNTFWVYYPTGRPYYGFEDSTSWADSRLNSYIRYPVPAYYFSLAHRVSDLGINIGMTILQPSIFHGTPDGIADLIDGVRLIGNERVDDEPCTIIEISYMEGQRTRTIWVSERDNLPRRLQQTLKLASNLANYEEWNNVKLDCDLPDSLFSWTPPDGWKEFRFPAIEDGLLSPGTQAPDFSFPLVTGENFRLSSQTGKPVIVNFWRVGCPPCRQEMPYLETLYRKYKGSGLVVLGFNFADTREIALGFLGKYGASYPNIVDSTETAQEVFFDKYQTLRGYSAVPLNYLIDAEGKVVQAWYGYDSEEDSTFENALRKVGL